MLAEDLKEKFEIEITKSENSRNRLMVALLCAGLMIVLVNFVLIDKETLEYYGGREGFIISAGWMLVFLVYQLFAQFKSAAKVKNGRALGYTMRLAHIVIEVIFPSALLFFYVQQGVISFIDSPIAFIYFLYSVLSILCLDFRISLFTGVLSGLVYGLIVYIGFNHVEAVVLPSNPSNTYYVRAVLIMLSGGAGAFVASGVRRSVSALLTTRIEKRKIEKLFGQQVSREVAEALTVESSAGSRAEATVLALDLRNFSSFAEHRTPDQILEFQNQVFGPILEIINQHMGVVNQIMGDGLMATFGAPNSNPLHADMAFQASLKIVSKIDELNSSGSIPHTRVGVGLHSGEVITGNIGNERRKQFSISGSAVIIAFRVEQLTKELNCDLLITEEVKNRIEVGKVELAFMGSKPLKGFGTSVNVFQVRI